MLINQMKIGFSQIHKKNNHRMKNKFKILIKQIKKLLASHYLSMIENEETNLLVSKILETVSIL
jgi:hypothetical protein